MPRIKHSRLGQKPDLTYYRAQTQKAQSPFEKRTPKRRLKIGAFFSRSADMVLIALIVLGLIYSLIVQPKASLTASTNLYHPAVIYQKAVQKQLSAFKNRNKISFDEASVVGSLKQQFPEVYQANVGLPIFGETPRIDLSIANPAFWLLSNGQRLVIDDKGTAVAKAAAIPQIKGLATVTDQSGFKIAAGQQALSSQDVNFILRLLAQCQRAKVPVSGLVLPTKVQEVDLRTADRSYYVKFFLGGDSDVQTGQFLAARHQFDQSGQQPNEYLDVRVSGKIYYK